MKYDFNKEVNRKHNDSAKWDEIGKNFISKDLLPMWVADMDFETAPEILEAMQKKLNQKIFGYVSRPDSYYESAANWTKRRYGYDINPKTLIHAPGVVPSISLILRLFSNENDKILIQSPVYYPFSNIIEKNNRKLVVNLLKEQNGKYFIDFEDFQKKCEDPDLKWFILCNPHNPVGRVWTRRELERMGEICLKNNVRVIADEIWRDLVYKDYKYIPFASLSKEIEDITITCFAATKTFNIAGLQASFVSFPRQEELIKFDNELGVLDIKRNNPFSLVAIEAAFNKGEPWLNELLDYLQSNLDFLIEYFEKNIPKVKVIKPEGTYLVWLDFRSLGLNNADLSILLQKEGKIALDDGFWFGENGGGFERINIACPRYLLEDGLKRIKKAVDSIK
ncbi:aminotransferase [Fervidicella metallireducens AeB]|uniref:cysteine-S-conjugate beta-lyase n=1 Tax=Fervidicella metallireducens AeB TaxID=1403537 RepID=A0A017RWC0_9CLOT|nr:MalY/PatB family protein [Fervidicella metallireducens]EYE88906.1 aminotransferase [Fervidicella metallireducens AeB]